MRLKILYFLIGINLVSCYRNHFYVQQEWVDREFLASSHIHTPDPRQENPPFGQRLLVNWSFPKSLFEEHLTLFVTVRLWDNTETTLSQPIENKRGFAVFFFDVPKSNKRILTYRVQAISETGEIVGYWTHQLWTKLIKIGAE